MVGLVKNCADHVRLIVKKNYMEDIFLMKLPERLGNILDVHDIGLCGEIEGSEDCREYCVELEMFSPKGEGVIITIWYDGTEENFIKAFNTYANEFDAEEHAETWIKCREKNGIPSSIKDLLEDAEWIKNTLMDVAEELNNLDEESEESSNMNREQFYNYIVENFNISGEAKRLINSILHFVEENYTEENEQYRALCDLLDGTIGLSDKEIRRVYM